MSSKEVRIQLYQPHPNQQKILASQARFKVIVCGRRFGKTTLAINELIYHALLKSGSDYWYVAPTYRQAKEIAWRMLKKVYLSLPEQLRGEKNESELWVEVGNKSRVSLKGADNEDSLRGSALDGIIVDEVDSVRNWQYLWHEVLAPSLVDRRGWGWFIGTPKGFYNLYNLSTLKDSEYASFHFTSYDNPYLDQKEIDKERARITENSFAQEYLADFRKYTGLVFKEFDREIHTIPSVDLPGSDSYYRCIDFGAVNPTACLYIRVDSDGNFYVYDEYYESEKSTEDNAYAIRAKHPQTNFIATFGDPSGKQERIDYAKYGVHITQANKQVLDAVTGKVQPTDDHSWILHRIGLIQERLKVNPVTRRPRLFIHKDCVNTIREFESYRWQERKDLSLNAKDVPEKADDHTIDALGYFMCSYEKRGRREFRQPERPKPSNITGYF